MPILTAGNINVTSLVVPDLYVQIVPPSQLTLNGVPSNLVALVGTASFGPLNTPINVSSYAQFNQYFGGLNNRKYDMGTHVAVAVQQGANNLQCVRTSDGTEAAATIAVGSTNITFSGLYTGTFGNSITVNIATGSKLNTWRAIVQQVGFAAEVFDNIGPTNAIVTSATTAPVSSSTTIVVASTVGIVVGDVISGTGVSGTPTVASITNATTLVASAAQTISSSVTLTFTPSFAQVWTNMAAAINSGQSGVRPASQWITATAGGGTTTPTVTQYALAGGTDGVASITSALVVGSASSPPTGMYALGTGWALLDVCDLDDSTKWTSIDSFANQSSGYAIQVIPTGTTVAASVSAKQTAGLDSYNSKLMKDWCYWADPVLGINRLVSPQGFIAGRLGNLTPQLTSLNKNLYGVVGTEKSGLIGNVMSSYAQGDLNTLVSNGIEIISNPGAGGIHIWTARFGHNSSSNPTVHGDNYTTLTNYIAQTINAGMGPYLGQVINPQIFVNVTTTLTQYCQTLSGAGLIGKANGSIPYAIVCNTSNNPSYSIAQGILNASVQMSYQGIVEKFIINLQNGTELAISKTIISNTQ